VFVNINTTQEDLDAAVASQVRAAQALAPYKCAKYLYLNYLYLSFSPQYSLALKLYFSSIIICRFYFSDLKILHSLFCFY
jgi:hypothetical protein